MHLLILIGLTTLLSTGVPEAQPTMPQAAEALDGLDPVLLVGGKEVPGKSGISVTRGGFTYLFSSAESKATFEGDPARYEIQLGGMCARMGKTAGGNAADFMVHEGRIYIFGSDDCHKKFAAAPAKYLATAAPPLPASASAATRARQLLDRAVVALGGAARLDGLRTYAESFSQTQARPQGEARITTRTLWSFPDRVRQDRTMNFQGKTMTSATVLSPEGMWFVGGQGQAFPIRSAARPSLEQDFARHPIALLHERRQSTFKAVALGKDTVGGFAVENVRIVFGASDVTLAIGASGRIHSATFRDRNLEGEIGSVTIVYSDFRPVEGLQLPFKGLATFNGQPDAAQSMTLETIDLNPPAAAALFTPGVQGGR